MRRSQGIKNRTLISMKLSQTLRLAGFYAFYILRKT